MVPHGGREDAGAWDLRWVPWERLRETWGDIREQWGLPRSFATASFYLDFFHNLSRLSLQVLEVRSRERTLALFPAAIRKRGPLREIHAMPWAMPGGCWISPTVPERRRAEVLKAVEQVVRRSFFLTFVDRFGTVGLAWDLPQEPLIHYVIPPEATVHTSVQRSQKRARARWEVKPFSREAMREDLYPVYREFMAAHRAPFMDPSFFDTFFQTVPPAHRITLGLWEGSRWQGGILGIGDGDEALLWLVFLAPEARRGGGYHLLVGEAVEEARRRGWYRVDLGHHPTHQAGLSWLKRRLGAEEETHAYFVRPRWVRHLQEGVNRVWYRRRVRP